MRRWVWRAARSAAGWWWRSARPSTGVLLPPGAPARPAHETGRAPRPDERWVPSSPATGPWADVDPHAAGRWPRAGSVAAVAAWAAAVGWRLRKDLRRG